MKIKLIEAGPSAEGTQVGVGTINVEDLVNHFEVDVFDHKEGRAGAKGGYQRKPKPYRIKAIAKKISSGNYYIPVGFVMNVRKPNKPLVFKNGIAEATITGKLQILDGSNRTHAFQEVMNNPEEYGVDKEEFGLKKVNVVVFWGSKIEEEVLQFFDINHFAQSVPPGNRIEIDAYLNRSDQITTTLIDVVWALQDDPLWGGVIQFPNSSEGIIPNNGFVVSLKPLWKDSSMKKFKEVKDIKKLINAVWGGMEMVFPDIFENKEDYSLQRAIGVNTIHSLIPTILTDIGDKNQAIYNKDEQLDFNDKSVWYDYFKDLRTLRDTNRDLTESSTGVQDPNNPEVGKPVEGADIWLRGKAGAVGKYSSAAGRDYLNEMVRLHLNLGSSYE